MKNKNILIIGVLLIGIVFGGWWITKDSAYVKLDNPFSVSQVDTIGSWNFTGVYNDGGELEARALAEIVRLEKLLKEKDEKFTDYILYVSIAAQYDLLGDGEKVFEYLGDALAVDADNTGLAWHNMGKLMTRLGAYESARTAFNNAVKAQALPVYYMSLIDFLEEYFPDDKLAINNAKKAIGLPYEDDSSNK